MTGPGPICCLGCRMAAAIVEEKGEQGAARGLLTRLGLSIFFSMNVMAFTMALWTTDVYEAGDPSNRLMPLMHGLFRYVVLLFSLPVLWLLGLPLFTATWDSLRKGILSTDALLSLGVAASFAVSFLSVLRGSGPIYFEVGCVILVMTTLGRWLEATGRLKATSALDALAKLLPATVRRVGPRRGAGDRAGARRAGRPAADPAGRAVSRRRPGGGEFGPGRRAGAHRGEPAGPQGARGADPGRDAQPGRRARGRGQRDRRRRHARPPRRDGQAGEGLEGPISAAGGPDLRSGSSRSWRRSPCSRFWFTGPGARSNRGSWPAWP